MKTLIPLALFAFFAFSPPAHAGIRENGGFLVPSATELDFTSPGNGIDNELKDAVVAIIESYHSAGFVQAYKKSGYGMEGELKICVQLNELEVSRRLNQELEEMIGKSERKTIIRYISSCEKEQINGPFQLKSAMEPFDPSIMDLRAAVIIERVAYTNPNKVRSVRNKRIVRPIYIPKEGYGSDDPLAGSVDGFKRYEN